LNSERGLTGVIFLIVMSIPCHWSSSGGLTGGAFGGCCGGGTSAPGSGCIGVSGKATLITTSLPHAPGFCKSKTFGKNFVRYFFENGPFQTKIGFSDPPGVPYLKKYELDDCIKQT
jgi:hypothetical protein